MRRLKPVMSLEEVPEEFGLGWAARLLIKNQDWVVAAAKAGTVPARRVEGQWIFKKDELLGYIRSC